MRQAQPLTSGSRMEEVPAASLEWKAPSPCGLWLYPLLLLSLSAGSWWAWLPSQPHYSCANAHHKAKGSEGQPRNLFLVDFGFFFLTSLDLQRTCDDSREFPYTRYPGSPTNRLVTHSPLVLINEPHWYMMDNPNPQFIQIFSVFT